MKHNARTLAARAVAEVVEQGHSLSNVLPRLLGQAQPRDRGLVQELCYGTLRWYPRLDAVLKLLLQRPLKDKDQDLRCLLLVGLYQLGYLALAEHGVVHDSVEAVRQLGKPWATKLVNGVLRNFQRQQQALLAGADKHDVSRLAHPQWLLERLRKEWPDDWSTVAAANNAHPPMSLRVNGQAGSRAAYLAVLDAAGIAARPIEYTECGIQLETALGVDSLPGFADGGVSVQDGAAQLAAQLLDARPGMRVLDACAAPGGKTCHVLERTPGLAELVAVDRDAERLERVEENLERLHLQAHVMAVDAARPQDWWDDRPFERILLDAPCTASGVIRRHPDIKLLRKPQDVKSTVEQQRQLLEAVWSLLAPGGMLVYCTCSVLRAENSDQVAGFLANHDDAEESVITAQWGRACEAGRQILPGEQDMDGFYYACLTKRESGTR